MAQIFQRSANSIAKASIPVLGVLLGGVVWALYALNSSSYVTEVGIAKAQPVPFPHKHHVLQLGIDCRYCHTSVEVSNYASIPPTETCMSCHSQIYANAEMLEPVRRSWRTGESIPWTYVHDIPDYVYFNHSIHINKGIGCSNCHGRVDQMPLIWKVATFEMQWCLDCHSAPEKYIRPREAVFQMDYQPPPNQLELGERLVKEYKVQKLLDCYTCHR